MSMSTHIQGLRDIDGKLKKMLEVKKACEDAGILYPKELQDYFGGCAEEAREYLIDEMRDITIPTTAYQAEGKEGLEIKVEDIPKECKIIRFYSMF